MISDKETISSMAYDKAGTSGYLHQLYAKSFAEFGNTVFLPRSGGWLIERQIKQTIYRDGMGCYPLFSCQEWPLLLQDIVELEERLVSVVIVADPFGEYKITDLKKSFPDRCFPFKEHHVIDLKQPPHKYVSQHHQRNAIKARSHLQIEKCEQPEFFLADWQKLYLMLIERHGIKGISAFSKQSFARQLKVPGLVMFRAMSNNITVGMLLWYVQNRIGYYHLGAYSEQGYELRASFALFWEAICYFQDCGLHWLNLGGGAGLSVKSDDGLSRFKRGWATDTRTAYFCGRILNHERHAELVQANAVSGNDYFPLYRKGEF